MFRKFTKFSENKYFQINLQLTLHKWKEEETGRIVPHVMAKIQQKANQHRKSPRIDRVTDWKLLQNSVKVFVSFLEHKSHLFGFSCGTNRNGASNRFDTVEKNSRIMFITNLSTNRAGE